MRPWPRGRLFYAVEHAYGPEVLNRNGPNPDFLAAFRSRAGRDAWIQARPRRRRPVSASAPAVRREWRRCARREGAWYVIPAWSGDTWALATETLETGAGFYRGRRRRLTVAEPARYPAGHAKEPIIR